MVYKLLSVTKRFLVLSLMLAITGLSVGSLGVQVAQAAEGSPQITLTSPAGGETYMPGDTVSIKWNQVNVDSVWIGYMSCDPGCLDWIVASHPVDINASSGSYSWQIPSNFTAGTYKIDISGFHTGVGSTSTKSPSFTIGSSTPTPNPTPIPIPSTDAYKAVVKVNTFMLNTDYELGLAASGSGVIIKSDGTLLTNYHVIESEDAFRKNNRPATFQICIPQSTTTEPDCSYTAKLLAVNKDLDLAVLKIQTISGLSSLTSFPYISLRTTDIDVNTQLTVIGYPEIGNETVTVTSGIVSGKLTKYNGTWIKTDALISFGNSGGAALDAQNKLVGITTAAHSDVLGSLGYVISSQTFNSWLSSASTVTPQESTILSRLNDLTRQQKSINNSQTFTNSNPGFSITKNSAWEFTYEGENFVSIENPNDDDSGYINVGVFKMAYNPSVENALPEYLRNANESGFGSVIHLVNQENITIGGKTGKKLTLSFLGQNIYDLWFPHGNYMINMTYLYGFEGEDRATIDSIVQSLRFLSVSNVTEQKSFTHSDPTFSLSAGNDWSFKTINQSDSPLLIHSKVTKEAYGEINLERMNDEEKGQNNDTKLQNLKQQVTEINQLQAPLDLKTDITASNAHLKLNSKLTDVIMIATTTKRLGSGEVLSQDVSYYVKSGDMLVSADLAVYSSDITTYSKAQSSFLAMLQSWTLSASTISSPSSGEERVIKSKSLYTRLKGNILLKVEDGGKAYYVHPTKERSYYLGRPADAFRVMREQGIGITNNNLKKIPVGLTPLTGSDQDQDGLSDMLEDAIGTNKLKADTDGDGHSDKVELVGNYNPAGPGMMSINTSFASSQRGRILIQVEGKGEAWYINPKDGKRYFLGRADDAFSIMRSLGMGINNRDFDTLN